MALLKWQKHDGALVAVRPGCALEGLPEVEAPEDEAVELAGRLLDIGGAWVALKDACMWAVLLLVEKGGLLKFEQVENRVAPLNDCHLTSAQLYEKHLGRYRLYHGMALSERLPMWHHHSWLIQDGVIIEGPISRDYYFGFELTGPDAEAFCRWAEGKGDFRYADDRRCTAHANS